MPKIYANLPIPDVWGIKPPVPAFMHGWFAPANKAVLNAAFEQKPKTILELGAWYGKSTKYLLDGCPGSSVYSVDIWNDELSWIQENNDLKAMVSAHPVFETFLVNLWEYRDRLCPIKMHSLEAIPFLQKCGVEIDCVYLDSGHYYEETKQEVAAIKKHFPTAFICGDDYSRNDCRKGLNEVAKELGMSLLVIHNAWILIDDAIKHKFEPYEQY